MATTRTAVVKNLDETFVHIIAATANTIVAARSVSQRLVLTAADTFGTPITSAVRGAGHTGAGYCYAVALTSVKVTTTITLGGETAAFAAGDPPGTAVPFSDTIADIVAVPTVVAAVGGIGDMFAIVAQPPSYSSGLISYVTAKGNEPPGITRDIRDRGQLQHRKRMSVEYGTLTLTAKYANAKAGLSKYVDQNVIVICERDDNRSGVVTEKEIFYGAHINAIPAPNESEGDTDTTISVPVSYELLAIVGEDTV